MFNHCSNACCSTFGIGLVGSSGLATDAKLYQPTGIAFNSDGELFNSDNRNHKIRKVFNNGTITTVVGTGSVGYLDGVSALEAKLNRPSHCNGVAKNSSQVCSCSIGYYGNNCPTFNCSGIDSSIKQVCSSRGLCTAPVTSFLC